jgi:metal iron transporter
MEVFISLLGKSYFAQRSQLNTEPHSNAIRNSIIGATVMPHAFFIGSKIATVHRITNYSNDSTDSLDPSVVISPPVVPKTPAPKITFARLSAYYLGFIKKVYPTSKADLASNTIAIDSSAQASSDSVDDSDNKDIKSAAVSTIEEDPDLPRTLEMIRIHIMHVSIDIAISLITLAIAINSAILIVAAAVFFYGTDIPSGSANVADLFAAYDLVSQYVGTGK